MKAYSFVMMVVGLWAAVGLAQAPDTVWTRSYGIGGTASTDWHFIVEQTVDGGFIATGRNHTGVHFDIPLVKLDANGDTMWTRNYGTSTYFEGAYAIDQTADGGYILAGQRDIGPSRPLLTRVNGTGTQEWMSIYLASFEQAVFYAVHELPNGDLFAAGVAVAGGGGAPIRQFMAMRFNSVGDTIWTRQYGGPEYEWCHDAILTADGNALLVGYTRSFGAIGDDVRVLKITLDGDSLWSRRYGTSDNEDCNAVTETADGGYALTGYRGENLFLLKINAAGDSVMSAEYPAGVGRSIQELAGGDLSIAGLENNLGDANFWLLRTSPTFGLFWSTTYGGAEENSCHGHDVTSDGGYVLGGFTNFGGNRQLTVVKYNEDRGLALVSPNGGETWTLYDSATVLWSGVRFNGNISIELNRNYPGGTWEMLAADEINDGAKTVFVDAPISSNCRVRVSTIEDTLVDVSDANFSIVPSGGFLALVRVSTPTTPDTFWNFGTLECPDIGLQEFRLKNFGNQPIQVYRPDEPNSNEFSRVTTCPQPFVLMPGQMTTCQVTLNFTPIADGLVRDTMRIRSNASNARADGFVYIPLSGSQVSTPSVPQIVITTDGDHVHLHWDRITESIQGCAVDVTHYLVFYSPTSIGPYYFHGYTSDTTYTHVGVVRYAPAFFYRVTASTAPLNLLLEIPDGMMMDEVFVRLRCAEDLEVLGGE